MKTLCLAMLLAFFAPAHAQQKPDNWNSGDKRAHFASGAIASALVTNLSDSAGAGMLVGCGAGVLGEVGDALKYGAQSYHVSYKDATAQCLGSFIGAGVSLIISTNRVEWRIKF